MPRSAVVILSQAGVQSGSALGPTGPLCGQEVSGTEGYELGSRVASAGTLTSLTSPPAVALGPERLHRPV